MKNYILFLFVTSFLTLCAQDDPKNLKAGIPVYIPPQGWQMPDPKTVQLPKFAHSMIVGKSPSTVPPSINLCSQAYNGTLKQYLQMVKEKNEEKGDVWKDLGTIKTGAGVASLSQTDSKTQCGDLRQMHTILVKNGTVYIMTAGALKSEYSQFYQDFFNAMTSLRIASDIYDTVPNAQLRSDLTTALQKLKNETKDQQFESESFQKNVWIPFKEMLNKKYKELGNGWIEAVLNQAKTDLFKDNPPITKEQKLTTGENHEAT